MTQLLHLNLSNCSLGSHGARVLSTVIPFVSKLQSLYLTHNHIFGRSMHRICGIISSLRDLHLLELNYNSLEEQGARDLSRSLRCCPLLTHLHCNNCSLGENGIQSLLVEALPVLSNLQSLKINNNGAPPNAECFRVHILHALSCVRSSISELCFRQLGRRINFSSNLDECSCSGMRADIARSIVEALSCCCSSIILDDDALSKLLSRFKMQQCIWNPELEKLSMELFPANREDILSSSLGIKEIFESSIVLHPRTLGRGAYGEVGLATWIHSSKNESVAVKKVTIKPGEEGKFETELNIMNRAKRFELDNIVHVLAYFLYPTPKHSTEQKIGIVMPYFEMGSLYRALHHHESYLTWNVKLQLAMDVCLGLDALHSRIGVVHRDIKAENVLLKRETEGEVTRIKGYVCDFGVSAPRQLACHQNSFYGTIVFAAPELFHQPKYTYQSDVYSFGCLLHELLLHRRPFETIEENGRIIPWNHDMPGVESMALFKRRRAAGLKINIPIQGVEGLPDGFVELLHNCIEPNPEDRPQSMRIIYERLQKMNASLSPACDVFQPITSVRSASSSHVSSNSWTSHITYTISGDQLDAFLVTAPSSIVDAFNQ